MVRRIVSNENPYAILWQKKGRGTMHLLDGRKIKSGEKFRATEAEVAGLETWLIPLQEKPSEKKVEQGIKPVFFLRQRAAGYWDLVDNQGKVVNDKALRKDKAEELKKDLEG